MGDLFGMIFFDAINHSLTTNSTGGFSTKQGSIEAFDSPLIEFVIMIFMFIAGTNFTLIYFGFKGKFSNVLHNDEFKWYLGAVLGLILFLTPVIYYETGVSLLESLRDVSFQVVSTITTTGYASADFTTWGSLATFIFFLLLFSGASAGSTSGGIKIVRIVILIKNGFLEFKKRLQRSRNSCLLKQEGYSESNYIQSIGIYFPLFIRFCCRLCNHDCARGKF